MSLLASGKGAFLGVVLLGVTVAVVGLRRSGPPTDRPADLDAAPLLEARRATPELAEEVLGRLRLFREGDAGSRLTLDADEVTALIRHAIPGILPAGISDPVVGLQAGIVVVRARLVPDDFAGRAPLASVLGALPDTVDVELRGRLVDAGQRLVFTVEGASASRVPLPGRAVAAIAAAVAEESDHRVASRDDGRASLSVRWPRGVTSAMVVEGRLVLGRDERMTDRAVDGSDDL